MTALLQRAVSIRNSHQKLFALGVLGGIPGWSAHDISHGRFAAGFGLRSYLHVSLGCSDP